MGTSEREISWIKDTYQTYQLILLILILAFMVTKISMPLPAALEKP